MNKIDLIIDRLELAKKFSWNYLVATSSLEEALSAARELRELEPVAWVYKDNTVTTDPDRADGTWTKLYDLGE